MEYIILNFATAETTTSAEGDLFGSVGIDWKLLVIQIIAFIILMLILKKFVYPPLSAVLDKREADIRASTDAAMEAEKKAAISQLETAKLLDQAKEEAVEIVTTARDEASNLIDSAQKKAEARTEAMINSARDEIVKEVAGAKRELEAGALELVALATGKVLDEKVDAKKDAQLITKALKEAK